MVIHFSLPIISDIPLLFDKHGFYPVQTGFYPTQTGFYPAQPVLSENIVETTFITVISDFSFYLGKG